VLLSFLAQVFEGLLIVTTFKENVDEIGYHPIFPETWMDFDGN
jgi:hypothetical protein